MANKVSTKDMEELVVKYLNHGSNDHLSDCLDMVEGKELQQVYEMIVVKRNRNVSKDTIAEEVAHDIACFVAGVPEAVKYCNSYN